MTRFRYIAVALVALAPIGAQAACSGPWPAPTFAVAVEDPPVAYDFNEDRAALAKIAGKNGMPSLGQAEIPYGITIGRYDLDIVVETDSVRNGPGLCTHLRSAHAVVGLKQLDVVIDRRFGAGSCQRQAVLDHERQHVEIFREAIRYYEPAIERALAAATIAEIGLRRRSRRGARRLSAAAHRGRGADLRGDQRTGASWECSNRHTKDLQ